MGNYDINSESSDSDSDDFLREEIEALTRACVPPHNPSSGGVNISELDDDDDDDDFNDLELVRSIQARYGVDVVDDDIKPLASLPPPVSDDDDDDYEFYRAIKERFSNHDPAATAGTLENKDGSCTEKSEPTDVKDTTFRREFMDGHRDDVERELHDFAEEEDSFSPSSRFPQAAQTFIEAIKKNRYCQKFIRNKLLHIEAKMEEIKKLRKRLKTLRDFQVGCKKKIGRALSQKQDAHVQLISVHKLRANAKGIESNASALCYGPQENSYVACYKAALERFPLSFHRDNWSEEDREHLKKGILQQYQEKLFHRSALVLSSAEEPGLNNGVDATMSSIRDHNISSETIQLFSSEVNWQNLASTYLPRRSGEECETRWFNHENPLINLGEWTQGEDVKLLSLIQKNGFHSWRIVAEKLATKRTPYQCLARYQRSLNAGILKRDWAEVEDDQLRSAVEMFGESNWQAVASVLVGRTGTQCSNRWKKTLHPSRKRVGKWGDDEDKRLKVGVALFGKIWHKIAQFVPGRTQSQCRERWVNVLDPSMSCSKWTEEEDMKLTEAAVEHGYSWAKVAACLPMRTDNQCMRRWKTLYPHKVPALRAARTIQKVALISNFVDREEERPALGPMDFVSLPFEGKTNEQEMRNGTKKRRRRRHSKCEETEPTEKLSPSLKRRKRAKSARPPVNHMDGDTAAEESNDEDNLCVDNDMATKTGSKRKKRNAVERKRESKKKSCENKETNQNCEEDCWNIPIRISSRRARGVKPMRNPPVDDCNLSQGSAIHDDAGLSSLEVNRVQHGQSIYSDSQVNKSDGKEVELSDMDVMAGDSSSLKLQPQLQSISTTPPEDDDCMANELGISDNDTLMHWTDTACLNKRSAKKKPKKSKVDTNQLEEWEDLPLSVLFKKASTRTH